MRKCFFSNISGQKLRGVLPEYVRVKLERRFVKLLTGPLISLDTLSSVLWFCSDSLAVNDNVW